MKNNFLIFFLVGVMNFSFAQENERCRSQIWGLGLQLAHNSAPFNKEKRATFESRRQFYKLMKAFGQADLMSKNKRDWYEGELRTYQHAEISLISKRLSRKLGKESSSHIKGIFKFKEFMELVESVDENYSDYFLAWMSTSKKDVPWEQIQKMEKGILLEEVIKVTQEIWNKGLICKDGKVQETPYSLGVLVLETYFLAR